MDPGSTYVNLGSTYVDLEFQIHSVDPGFTYVDHGSHAWIPDIYYDKCVDGSEIWAVWIRDCVDLGPL